MDKDSLFENSIWGDKAIAKWNAENKDEENFKEQKTINELAEEYNEIYDKDEKNKFSWVLKDDEGKIDLKASDQSAQWGIPNQVIGDPDTANVFLCLLNPRTRNDTSKCTSLKEYIDLENKNGGELFDSVEEYKKHIINNKSNILEQEISRVLSRKLSLTDINKEIEKLKNILENNIYSNKENEKFREFDKFKESWKKFQKDLNLSPTFKIILDKKFSEYIENEQDNDKSIQTLYDDLKESIKTEKEKWIKHWNDEFEEKKINLNKIEKNHPLFERFISQIASELNPLNDSYYFKTYYSNLLFQKKEKEEAAEKEKTKNRTKFLDDVYEKKIDIKFKNLKICDLELFPYRTIDEHGIKLENKYSDLKSSKYVASLIINRIKKYEIDIKEYELKESIDKKPIKPIFIFRSYGSWKETINYCLNSKDNDVNLTEDYEILEEKYFYRFPNTNGAITPGNIKKVRIPKDEFTKIRNKL